MTDGGAASEFPPFDSSLPMMMLRGREVVMAYFRPMLHEHGLTEQQWRVIRAVQANDGMEITDLARRCLILTPSLTRILRSLIERRLLSRQTVRGDNRRNRIQLTREGRALFETIQPVAETRYAALISRFGRAETDELRRLLYLLEEKAALNGLAKRTRKD